MTQDRWSAVDEYLVGQLVPADEALESALRASAEAGLPQISVSPAQGKLLNLLARAQGAPAVHRGAGGRAPGERDGDPDCRQQGV